MAEVIQYRDDDINYLTSLDEFRRIHEPFADRGIVHTVAVEMYELWANKSLFRFLATDPFIDVELHGWRHEHYSKWDSQRIFTDFDKALYYWESHVKPYRRFGDSLKHITTFLPPWNEVSDAVKEACTWCNIKLSHKKSDYRWQFHWWEVTPEDVAEVLDGGDPKSVMRRVKAR